MSSIMRATTEFGLIKKYFNFSSARDDVALGIGDDCALLDPPSGKQLAVTVDTLVAGVHFPETTLPDDIAYKALAVNLSDLAAIGAEPAWATLALTLPFSNDTWLDAFSKSLKQTLDLYGVQLIGGDTTQGPLSITIQLTGFVDANKTLRRDTAKPGDKIYVTGHLGDAALGLKLLGFQNFPYPEVRKSCVEKLNRPIPRIKFAQKLSDYSNCAIDISDGLTADLGHIITASKCGARIYYDKIPFSEEFHQSTEYLDDLDSKQLLLSGGDDYELCFTASPENEIDLFSLAKSCRVPLTNIGEINLTNNVSIIDHDGKPIELPHLGYEHFTYE